MKHLITFILLIFLSGCTSPVVEVSKLGHLDSNEFYKSKNLEKYPDIYKKNDLVFTLYFEGLGVDHSRVWLKVFNPKKRTDLVLIKNIKFNDLPVYKVDLPVALDFQNDLAEVYFVIPTVDPKSVDWKFSVEYQINSLETEVINFYLEEYKYRSIAWPT